MYQLFKIIIMISLISSSSPIQTIKSSQVLYGYTLNELLSAYESGQFRVINTDSNRFRVSLNGKYICALGDGVYRLSDGLFFDQFDNAEFSPNSNYLAQDNDGVYRLSDGQQILISKSMIVFSENEEYVAIGEDGVFRLSDQQRILESRSPMINFSPDSSLVATIDGIYRLSDGQRVVETQSSYAEFSPDSAYVLIQDDLFRLSDGAKILEGIPDMTFTPDMQYVVAPGNGVYRINDGEFMYALPEYAGYGLTYPLYSADGKYMAVDSNGLYRVLDGEKLFDTADVIFSPDSLYVAVGQDGVYRLNDKQKLFDVDGEISGFSEFSVNSEYLAISNGIYRIDDGQKLFENGWYATFSPDESYVVFDDDGLYRLNNQQKVFNINGIVRNFTQDGAYIHVGYMEDTGIYRVKDGYKYIGLQILDLSNGIIAIGNTILVFDQT